MYFVKPLKKEIAETLIGTASPALPGGVANATIVSSNIVTSFDLDYITNHTNLLVVLKNIYKLLLIYYS